MTGLLLDAFIFLLAAVIAVPLAKRLGLGSVLGYLLAGVVIGPVLGLAVAGTSPAPSPALPEPESARPSV